MNTCDVLRCGGQIRSVFNVASSERDIIEVRLCEEHRAKIDEGARWVYDYHEGSLLMGRDLPPRAVNCKVRGLIRTSEGIMTRFTFVVESHDGSQREHEFAVPPQVAEGIWRVLDRRYGKHGSVPGAPADADEAG